MHTRLLLLAAFVMGACEPPLLPVRPVHPDGAVDPEAPDGATASTTTIDAGAADAGPTDAIAWTTSDAATPTPTPDASPPTWPPFVQPDAAVDAAVATRNCNTPVSYGDYGAMSGPAFWADDPSVTVRDSRDVRRLALFMFGGKGIFSEGLKTGAYNLDVGIENCGACMFFTIYDPHDGHLLASYEAVSGSISISQMPTGGGQTVSVIVSGLTFAATVGDAGCTTYIERAEFSGVATGP